MNNVGQPPKYKTVKELQDKIDEYFNNLPTKKKVITNKITLDVPVPTITGLVFYLGFESRQSFYDMEKRKEFSYTIKRARTFIEKEYEEQLQVGNTIGAIFALKNMGWADRQEITGKDGAPIIPIQFIEVNDNTPGNTSNEAGPQK